MNIKSLMIAVLAVTALSISGCKDKAPAGMPQGKPENHPKIDTKSAIEIKPGSIVKASGGYTVAEIYAKKAALNGKSVIVRGKVVKFNADIMNRNWIHVQDGTGQQGSNDLTVTTINKAAIGETVLIEGKLTMNKDFGANYKYPVIIEGATIKVEK